MQCFHQGGGVPYEKFPHFHDIMSQESLQTTASHLVRARGEVGWAHSSQMHTYSYFIRLLAPARLPFYSFLTSSPHVAPI